MIYKLASKKKKKGNMYEAAAVGALAPIAAGTGITHGAHAGFEYVDKHLSGQEPELTNDRINEIYKHVGGDRKLVHLNGEVNANDLTENPLFVMKGADKTSRSAYTTLNMKIGNTKASFPSLHISSNSPESIVAHEMGHSTSKFVNSKAGRAMYGIGLKAAPVVGVGSGVRYAQARARGASKKELDKIKKQDDIAAVATSLPVVGEETRANLVALRAMKRMGQLNKRNLIPLLASEASYLSLPAMTPIGHKLVDKYYDWKQKK